MDIKNVFKQEAKSPPPQWAFITQEVREKFSPKKVRTRLRYKNQVEKLKLNVLSAISRERWKILVDEIGNVAQNDSSVKVLNQSRETLKILNKIGTKAIKIKMGNEFGGHEIKNSSADNKQKRICLTNLIFYNSIAINCFNLLQI